MLAEHKEFLHACRAAIGDAYVIEAASERAPFETEQRGRYVGCALAVLRPANTNEVAQLVRLCQQYRIPIVPQGGNTGLVLGSVPDQTGTAVILSLLRLNRVRQLDVDNSTMTVEAGCLLQQVQQNADDAGLLFPLSLASEGSCSIGGNLASNAGGTAVLRYGNSRELCLGVEVVTPDGEIWDGLRALRKDNTGYDLRDLFIGAEGTLGIITCAVLKLFPKPQAQLTCFAALPAPSAATALLRIAQQHCAANLSAFELISPLCLQLVAQAFPDLAPPFNAFCHASYVLLEVSSHESAAHAEQLLHAVFERAMAQGCMSDAVLASTQAQAQRLWQWRELISAAQKSAGNNIKHDISLPISCVNDFMTACETALHAAFPGCRVVCFGHLGDGNLHYNVSAPLDLAPTDFFQHQAQINDIVHGLVAQFNGSISAEHGIGALKSAQLPRYKSALELRLMRQIKQALDPHNVMNPGKILT